jgi:coenzyme F420-0:L-glutamate ligase/coenzyme F420-1:gamma-L-glutamate ligase
MTAHDAAVLACSAEGNTTVAWGGTRILAATSGVAVLSPGGRSPDTGGITAGIAPLRITEHTEPGRKTKRQEESMTDLVAAAAGLILGQRGRGAPVAVLCGITYEASDEGVAAMLHYAP